MNLVPHTLTQHLTSLLYVVLCSKSFDRRNILCAFSLCETDHEVGDSSFIKEVKRMNNFRDKQITFIRSRHNLCRNMKEPRFDRGSRRAPTKLTNDTFVDLFNHCSQRPILEAQT